MDKTISVNFTTEDYSISITFLIDLDRFEKGFISNLTKSGDLIQCWIVDEELDKSLTIDNENFIFCSLYKALKNKDKKFLKKELLHNEFEVIWKKRKPLLKLIKSLKKKYPELKCKNIKK